ERDDEKVCGNVEAALDALVDRWGADDTRALDLATEAQARWSRLSAPGRKAALAIPLALLHGSMGALSEPVTQVCSSLLSAATDANDAALTPQTLALATALVERAAPAPALDTCRALALRFLNDQDAGHRVLAINLCTKIGARADAGVLTKLLPL